MSDEFTDDRPILRKRLHDEALAGMLGDFAAVSTIRLMMLNEAIATTMLEHPDWPDA